MLESRSWKLFILLFVKSQKFLTLSVAALSCWKIDRSNVAALTLSICVALNSEQISSTVSFLMILTDLYCQACCAVMSEVNIDEFV